MANYLLHALVTLFVTIDPIALGPMFMALTGGFTADERRQTAVRASITAAAVLIVFAFVGRSLLTVLGISLSAFRIAGGLLLFWIAFEMVFEMRQDRKSNTADKVSADEPRDVAIFPLAVPLTSGPGAISATILLASQSDSMVELGGLIVVILILIGTCFAIFLSAHQVERAIGETGRLVVTRLLGLLLAALAIQFVADGIMQIVRGTAGV